MYNNSDGGLPRIFPTLFCSCFQHFIIVVLMFSVSFSDWRMVNPRSVTWSSSSQCCVTPYEWGETHRQRTRSQPPRRYPDTIAVGSCSQTTARQAPPNQSSTRKMFFVSAIVRRYLVGTLLSTDTSPSFKNIFAFSQLIRWLFGVWDSWARLRSRRYRGFWHCDLIKGIGIHSAGERFYSNHRDAE